MRRISLEQFVFRRRKRLGLVTLAVLVAMAILSWADHQGWFAYDGGDWRHYEGRAFKVVHVVDGDTLDIDTPDGPKKHTRVRLWGVNAPEIAHRQFGKNDDEPFGPEAARYVRRVADERTVTLRLQRHRVRDSFGRLLAYIQLPDGTVLNEDLIARGLAIADNRKGDPRYAHEQSHRYEVIEQQARVSRLGIWSNGQSDAEEAR